MALLPVLALPKPGTASWQLCSAKGWRNPGSRVLLAGVGGGNVEASLLPNFCRGLCPNLRPNTHRRGWAEGWGCFQQWEVGAMGWAPCSLQGLFANRRELAQGSRAPAGPGGL